MGQMNDPKIFRLTGDYENPNYMIDDVPMLTANPMSDRLPLVFDADPSSRASAASTSALNEPATPSSGSARRMSGDEASSPPTGPESPAPTTFELFTHTGGESYNPAASVGSLTQQSASETSAMTPLLLISSAAGSRAKTSASPDDEPDSPEPEADSSTSSPGSLTLFSPLADGSSLRTFPDFFPVSVAEISPSFSRRWPASGFTTSRGECWTADTSESPNAGAVSTSLRDVLEASVPVRYFLSPKAAAGILRRAEKRGRELPAHLESALRSVATLAAPANSTTRTTS